MSTLIEGVMSSSQFTSSLHISLSISHNALFAVHWPPVEATVGRVSTSPRAPPPGNVPLTGHFIKRQHTNHRKKTCASQSMSITPHKSARKSCDGGPPPASPGRTGSASVTFCAKFTNQTKRDQHSTHNVWLAVVLNLAKLTKVEHTLRHACGGLPVPVVVGGQHEQWTRNICSDMVFPVVCPDRACMCDIFKDRSNLGNRGTREGRWSSRLGGSRLGAFWNP